MLARVAMEAILCAIIVMEIPDPLKILLIEDSSNDAELLLRDLKKSGFNIKSARVQDGDTLTQALSEPWDLIICDFVLPRFNYREAIRIVRESGCDAPFFMVSGIMGEETAVEAMQAGADDYFKKGALSRLAPAIRRALAAAEEKRKKRAAEAEKRALEAKLQQAQKMEAIGCLASGIAHDFNNILGSIMGYSELAEFNLIKGNSPGSDIEQIKLAALRAKSIVQQMLSFCRPSSSVWDAVNLDVLIEESLKLLRTNFGSHVNVTTLFDSNLPPVRGDHTQICQVAINLVSNAVQAIPKNKAGEIKVQLTEISDEDLARLAKEKSLGKDYVKLSVIDNGTGMAPEILNRIKEPFFSTKAAGEGTGLGLWSVQNIVNNHNGHLYVESELGKGSAFHVYLPIYKGPASAERTPVVEFEPIGSNIDLLYVDSEASLAELGKLMLTEMGFNVLVTISGAEALKIFQENPQKFSVVVTADRAAGISGLSLLERIKALNPGVKSILTTSSSENPDLPIKGQDVVVLRKPYSLEKMVSTIRELVV